MTLTFRTTRRVYQRHPRGAPDGVISAPLARYTSANGEFRIGTEAERTRLYDVIGNPFTASFVGRLVTVTNTPPTSSTAGTKRAENWTFLITAVAGDGSYAELAGYRADVAGTGITYKVHASATFTAPSANFPTDEAPAAERTNAGPVVGQSIYLFQPTDQSLRLVPWTVTRRTSATVLTISDPFDLLASLPTESGLQWELRDRPAYTPEEVIRVVWRFLRECGWELHQFRGRNNGAGAGKRIMDDLIFHSSGEDNSKRMYLRVVAANANASGAYGSGNLGLDFAMFSKWDRDFVNAASDLNPGNGVNPVDINTSAITAQSWAGQADTANLSSNAEPAWGPDQANGSFFSANSTFGSGSENSLNTPGGGEVQEIHYTLFGNKDAVELYFECYGIGHHHISLGSLTPRPDGNDNNFVTNSAIANGSNVTVRIGGPVRGLANTVLTAASDGTNPAAPSSGLAYQVGDAIQVVGQTVNAGITPGTSHSGEFIESSTITAFPGNLAAIGSITTVVANNIVDGESVIMDDGTGAGGPNANGVYIFEFRKTGSPSGTNIAVALTAGWTADQVKTALISAVNGSAIAITASSGGTGLMSLVHDVAGGVGNVTIVDTVGDAGFVCVGMNGGGYGLQLAALTTNFAVGALVGEDPQPNYLALPFHKGASNTSPFGISGVVRLSNRARNGDATYKDCTTPVQSATSPGFFGTLVLAAASDLMELNPSDRTGRFGIVPLFARDTTQLRGSLPFFRVGSPRLGDWKIVRDRDGKYHVVVPFQTVISGGDESTRFVACFGPMPQAMALNQ